MRPSVAANQEKDQVQDSAFDFLNADKHVLLCSLENLLVKQNKLQDNVIKT